MSNRLASIILALGVIIAIAVSVIWSNTTTPVPLTCLDHCQTIIDDAARVSCEVSCGDVSDVGTASTDASGADADSTDADSTDVTMPEVEVSIPLDALPSAQPD